MKVTELSCILRCLQTFVLFFISVRLCSSASCTFASCKISLIEDDASKKTIDLNKYKDFLKYKDQDNNRDYYFQPCGTIASNNVPGNCIGFKGCQRESDTISHPIGRKDNPACTYTTGSTPYLNFAAADDGTYKRALKATYFCDKTQDDLILKYTATIPGDEATYEFDLRGKDACAKSGGGGGGGGGGGPGLDGASVFLILFFVVIAVYLIAGLVYKGAVKGARGTEIIPNVEFWKQVPGFIRDGALFIYRSIASKFCNKEYNQV